MTSQQTLQQSIEYFFSLGAEAIGRPEALTVFHQLRAELEAGTLRSAEPDPTQPTGWRVNAWVKRGILLGFRLGTLQAMNGCEANGDSMLSFVDKATYPARRFTPEQGIRVVRVHLSAAAQIGGVLEPVNASPVVIEDDVLVGGNTGVYEGTIVRSGAVLAAGVVLTRGTPVFDLPRNTVRRATAGGPDTPAQPLVIPEGAVVVPGARAITHGPGKELGLSLYAPVIVKYRDDKTALSTALEDLLR